MELLNNSIANNINNFIVWEQLFKISCSYEKAWYYCNIDYLLGKDFKGHSFLHNLIKERYGNT